MENVFTKQNRLCFEWVLVALFKFICIVQPQKKKYLRLFVMRFIRSGQLKARISRLRRQADYDPPFWQRLGRASLTHEQKGPPT